MPLLFILIIIAGDEIGLRRVSARAQKLLAAYKNSQIAAPTQAQNIRAADTTMTMAESTPYTVLDRATWGTLLE